MEQAILFSGIGGQGVQLIARTLAMAAVSEGRDATVFGSYGANMRGGNTDSTIVIGDGPLLTPPIIDDADAALMMHHIGWAGVAPKMRPGGIVVVDTSVFVGELDYRRGRVVRIDATSRATALGLQRSASMLALGAFAAVTRTVGLDALLKTAREVLPSYRAQHIEANDRALRAGYEAGLQLESALA